MSFEDFPGSSVRSIISAGKLYFFFISAGKSSHGKLYFRTDNVLKNMIRRRNYNDGARKRKEPGKRLTNLKTKSRHAVATPKRR